MKKSRKASVLAAAIFVVAAAGIVAAIFLFRPARLTLKTAQGKTIASWPAETGDTFTVMYTHSVNKSPVYETFLIDGKAMRATELRYSAFGVGMPTEIDPTYTLSYAEDGTMIVSGDFGTFDALRYNISTHILEISGQETDLRALCGEYAAVVFTVE